MFEFAFHTWGSLHADISLTITMRFWIAMFIKKPHLSLLSVHGFTPCTHSSHDHNEHSWLQGLSSNLEHQGYLVVSTLYHVKWFTFGSIVHICLEDDNKFHLCRVCAHVTSYYIHSVILDSSNNFQVLYNIYIVVIIHNMMHSISCSKLCNNVTNVKPA